MSDQIWVGLNARERETLLHGLTLLRKSDPTREIETLAERLAGDPSYPQITVGVYGGQVQWTLGNPFPIRICDYDGDREDHADIDERGQHCRIWFEPARQI
jgi:hypothetical protein